jgi:Glycosyl hydrolases family 6
MMHTLVARNSERVHNSFAPFSVVDAALVPLFLLTLGLTFVSARVGGQTVSRAFVNLFSDARLYVDPASAAKRQADAWRRSRPSDAALMDSIAAQPVAQWLGGWNVDIGRDVGNAVSRITGSRALPVFVAYNIPGRDCGQYSGWWRQWERCVQELDSRFCERARQSQSGGHSRA